MRFLAVVSYMTFLVAIERYPQGKIVTGKVTWILTVTTKRYVILRSAIR